ncbi:hypothetical protein BGZ96_001540 [Linnemannia gamsii]|uniref:F-box domain-containing protein n=1 Tax=Linnemannia gamsii TaxID=64522 RepID=A0ABQ7K9H5_9FUNG|nr:hypothetical protein BGZ96_001540 [Linnemannia gamsii]
MSDSDEPSSSLKSKDYVASADPSISDEAEAKLARINALLESIASIPPIVDILISNLSYKDKLSCLHVCKLWSSIAQCYLWQHVRFRDVTAVPVPLTDENKAIVRSRAHRIRSLASSLADTTLLEMQCTHLESLELWVATHPRSSSNFTNFNFILDDNPGTAALFPPVVGPTAIGLIPMNRHLSSIDFKQIEYLSLSFTPELFLSFSQLPLRSLRLGLTWNGSESLSLAPFLSNCPSTLEKLEIYSDRPLPFHFMQLHYEISMTPEQAAPLQLPSLPNLRTLKFTSDVCIRDATMCLFPLLRQCPNLEELWIPSLHTVESATDFFNLILGKCLSIKTLRLSPPRSTIKQRTKGLRGVELQVMLQDECPVITTLVLNSGWSLETIELTCINPEHTIVPNPYVSTILQSCDRLKTLVVSSYGHDKSPISLRELVETNWASNQLENLSFLVSEKMHGGKGWWVETIGDNEQLQEDIAMLLFQLSMKYHAQKKYKGSIPSWLEIEAMLLPFEAAVYHTGGAMSLAAWKRIRPEISEPLSYMPQQPSVRDYSDGDISVPITATE